MAHLLPRFYKTGVFILVTLLVGGAAGFPVQLFSSAFAWPSSEQNLSPTSSGGRIFFEGKTPHHSFPKEQKTTAQKTALKRLSPFPHTTLSSSTSFTSFTQLAQHTPPTADVRHRSHPQSAPQSPAQHRTPLPPQTRKAISEDITKAMAYELPTDFINRARTVFLVGKTAGIHFPSLEGRTIAEESETIRHTPNLLHILETSHFTPEKFLIGMTSFILTYASLHSPQLPIKVPARNITLLQQDIQGTEGLIKAAQAMQATP
ncbi:hypothetical protein [Entomobacter blattae]|uniref:Uncharacterized protein n=1 Tax=Entomobacter blattae TaxID=2762277 RepID=A0A7H1NQR5_9PROT|nr:hypothetical protein [Entomobacter blattae]QNT78125.1 hypothetical protein JGUZn3_08930 [Entomobacter blattae]